MTSSLSSFPPGIRLRFDKAELTLTNHRTTQRSPVTMLAVGKPVALVADILRTLLALCPEAHVTTLCNAAAAAQGEAARLSTRVEHAKIEAILETTRVLTYDIPKRARIATPGILYYKKLLECGRLCLSHPQCSEARFEDFRHAVRDCLEQEALLSSVEELFDTFASLPPADPKSLVALRSFSDDALASLGESLLSGSLESPRPGVPGALARETARTGLLPAFRPKDLLTARLAELRRWLEGDPVLLGEIRSLTMPSSERGVRRGVAALETARGLLVTAVELQKDRVTRIGFLAPTEWSMRPDGLPVTWGTRYAKAHADQPRLHQHIETLFGAFDPCTDLYWDYDHA